MKLLESFLAALKSLRANKLRSGLTMLGIVIGVGFVILLVSLGSGARTEITQGIQGMGSNLIIVVPFKLELDIGQSPMQQGSPSFAINKLTVKTMEKLGRQLGDSERVGLAIQRSTYISRGKSRYFGMIYATGHNGFEIRDLDTDKGRFFTEAEESSVKQVIVLGRTVARTLFGNEDPIGKNVVIKGRKFKVVGIQEEKGRTMLFDQDSISYLPYTTATRMFDTSQPDVIFVKSHSPDTVELVGVFFGVYPARKASRLDPIESLRYE